jgi:hypothetical protein
MSYRKQAEIRRVQAGSDRSFYIVFPREFANHLKITKGDYLTWELIGDSLVVRKAIFDEVEKF